LADARRSERILSILPANVATIWCSCSLSRSLEDLLAVDNCVNVGERGGEEWREVVPVPAFDDGPEDLIDVQVLKEVRC